MLSEGAASPEVETSRQNGTFAGAIRTDLRPSDRRDSSTAPAASLGMTIISVTSSEAIAKSKGDRYRTIEHCDCRCCPRERFEKAVDPTAGPVTVSAG